MDVLVTLHLFADDYPPPEFWRLARWCRDHGADEWTVHIITAGDTGTGLATRLDQAMGPFRLPDAPRRHLTPFRDQPAVRPAELWRLTAKSCASLRELLPEGPFTYQVDADDWLED